MNALITGIAGFVGSTLAERLVADGWNVVGVDSVTPYYDVSQKRQNLEAVVAAGAIVHDLDLRTADLSVLLDEADVVFHQAGQPGVRASWAEFDSYVEHNVLVTQRLLEALRRHPVSRLVYASSSSVYGNAPSYPTSEDTLPRPQSPYGVTKLAAEHLAGVYARNWGVPTVSLRYFTVYGPRQRPDMATHRLVEAAIDQTPFPLFGTGEQIRDFTFVGDIVEANLLAAASDVEPGSVFNIAGGGSTTLNHVIETVGRLVGKRVPLDRLPSEAGDVWRTGGSFDAATAQLGWQPVVGIEDGLARQVEWHLLRR